MRRALAGWRYEDSITDRFMRSRASALASPSSAAVLMLRNAAASSSNATSITRSVAYHASIFRPPPARKASRCGSTSRRTRQNTGCGWSNVRATASCASSAAMCRIQPGDEIKRQERRIAGHGRGVVAGRARQPGVQARERAGKAADGVGDHRIAEGRVAIEVLVGVDQHDRRPAARSGRAHAPPSACRRGRPGPCPRRPCAGPARRRGRCR